MELCLGLQIAFEDNFVIRSTTDLEMLFPMIAAFEPQWVIIDELPTLKMQRTIAALRKRWPKLHILFFIPDRSFPRAQTQNILSNVDAVLYEPIAIAELKDLVSRLSANEHRLDQELLTTHLTLRQN